MNLTCIRHMPCMDGFAASWVVDKALDGNVVMYDGIYGQDPPDLTDQLIYMVDFSYKPDVILELAKNNRIVVIDHHKTARAALSDLNDPNVDVHFDMEHSGAVLAWKYFFPGEPIPRLIKHVEDRDLWKFEMYGTREINSALFSYEYDFDEFSRMVNRAETPEGWDRLFNAGAAIDRAHLKNVTELIKATERRMTIGGKNIPVANVPYTMASDGGNLLARQNDGIGATYFDTPEGRKFSLRSIGDIDVSQIATEFGGGGHRNAAGFVQPIGWEGE